MQLLGSGTWKSSVGTKNEAVAFFEPVEDRTQHVDLQLVNGAEGGN